MDNKEVIYNLILSYRQRHGISPSTRELVSLSGISSTASVNRILKELEKDGRIRMQPNRARSITLPDEHNDVMSEIFIEYLNLYDYSNHPLYKIAVFYHVKIYKICIFIYEYLEAIVDVIKECLDKGDSITIQNLHSSSYLTESEVKILVRKILNKEL